MRVFLILVVLIAALGFFFFPSLSTKFDGFSDMMNSEKKCTTQAGETYYGDIPKTVVCQKTELVDTSITVLESPSQKLTQASPNYENMRCDGRRFCSQMISCNEAKFFLENCPNTAMDGNNDGVPCEKQWCRF